MTPFFSPAGHESMGGVFLPFTDGAVVKCSGSFPLSLCLQFVLVEGNVSFPVGPLDSALTTPYVVLLCSHPGCVAQAFASIVHFENVLAPKTLP